MANRGKLHREAPFSDRAETLYISRHIHSWCVFWLQNQGYLSKWWWGSLARCNVNLERGSCLRLSQRRNNQLTKHRLLSSTRKVKEQKYFMGRKHDLRSTIESGNYILCEILTFFLAKIPTQPKVAIIWLVLLVKIPYLQIAIFIQKDITRFKISMDDVCWMYVFKSSKHLI